MSAAPPRAFSKSVAAVYLGRIPQAVARAWECGELAFQDGELLFLVDDPQAYPPAARAGVRLRNTALLEGRCPECSGLRPAIVVAGGVTAGVFPPELHTPDCRANATAIEGHRRPLPRPP